MEIYEWGLLFFIAALVALFTGNEHKKGFSKFISNIPSFIAAIAIGGICGLIALRIPTIINPWVNYIGFPVLLLIVIGLLTNVSIKKS